MQRVLADHQPSMDAIAMVAAVADLRRVKSSETKVSKQQLPELLATGWSQVPDLLAALSRRRPHGQTLLGFAALAGEDAALIAQGQAKLLDVETVNGSPASRCDASVPYRCGGLSRGS
jgi:phosphopantothenoylcysteine decarboxylase/phosphopantothenate--cysteine ligase